MCTLCVQDENAEVLYSSARIGAVQYTRLFSQAVANIVILVYSLLGSIAWQLLWHTRMSRVLCSTPCMYEDT